ncbi:MAG: hypothetical protein ACJ76N_20430 [Thermoanaerobaculia bacterium]
MKITTGTVVSGKIEVEGEPLPEGCTVTILAPEEDGFFELGPEDERELLAAIAEADAGDVIDGEEFMRELRGRRG